MTVAEAARELGIATKTVHELCRLRKIGHLRVGPRGGRIVITQAHLDEYRAACEVHPIPDPDPQPPQPRRVGRLVIPKYEPKYAKRRAEASTPLTEDRRRKKG